MTPAIAVSAQPTETSAPAAKTASDIAWVGFDKLSGFKYEVPDESATNSLAKGPDPDTQIPEAVKAFNGKRVSLKGFMLPLKVEDGGGTSNDGSTDSSRSSIIPKPRCIA